MTLLCGRYRYVRELGAGATGRVLLAHDEASAGALRALKVVSAQHAGFLSWEFSRLRAVEHPRLARVHELLRLSAAVHELSLPAGSLVLVEDFVAGERWGAYVRTLQGTKAREEAVFASALGVAEALSAVHDAGLVHGDVKADNVLVQPVTGEASLIDFGFARAPQLSAPLRGTPRTMAPELYAGVVTHAADVYALGATLYDLLGGGASSAPVRTFSSLPDVAPAWLELIRALTASDPQARPVDGGEALSLLLVLGKKLGFSAAGQGARFALSAPVRAPDVLARRVRTLPFVPYGTRVESVCETLFSGQIVVLHGPRGSGRTRLAREALRVFHERCLAQDGATFSCAESLRAVFDLPSTRVLCVLDPVSADQVDEALRAREACRLSGRELRVLCVSDGPVSRPGVAAFELERMNEAELRALALRALDRRELPATELSELLRASAGWPGHACALLERSLLGVPRELSASEERVISREAAALLELAAWLPRVLASPGQAAALGADVQRAEPAFAELLAHGLVQMEAGEPRLSAAAARSVRARTRDQARARYASKLVQERAQTGAEFWLFSRAEDACTAWLNEARALRANHEAASAREVLEEALSFVEDARLRRELAELERAAARYPRALAWLGEATDAEDALLCAELLRLSGDAVGARARVARIVAESGALSERAQALSARLQFDAGELELAENAVAALTHATNVQARAAACEVAILIALARGASGRDEAERAVAAARELGAARQLSRALSLRAQVLSRAGERGRALSDARAAAQQAKNADEMHESATFSLNLGLLEFEAGEIGRALEALDDAAYRLCMIDRPRDLVRVLYNLGNVALFIGDFARADVVLNEALARLSGTGDALALAHARLALSELCLVRGAIDEALALLTRALAELPEQVRPPLRALLHARSSQLWLLKENQLAAREQLASALALPLEEDVSAALEVDLARIRSALARSEWAQAERLSQLALARAHALTLPDRVRLLLAAIDSARSSGDELAGEARLSLCRALLERVLSGLSPRLRASMRAMPAHARVLESETRERPAVDISSNAERWRSLLRSARRLFDEPSRARLAQRTAELLLELVHAERVLLIMARDGTELRVLGQATLQGGAGRNPALTSGEERVPFSRSVVERALLEQAAVLTLEAGSDARFDAAQSLHAASVRSVLCVPLSGTPAGVLYLDDRMRGSAFSADDVALVEDLALLASQALHALSERRAQERRARKAEESRDALRTELTRLSRTGEGPASAIVHGSAVMTRLLDVARRVASTDAPVLITGESGSGKELVARFVHTASARRAAPFVAESCAALPETLLESALFGHVRGAFTGADRARKGLFELADQGTLLLDEVAEMVPSMQAKLLRVLQEGEVRPVGSERTLRVDVRVLFATHRDLEALVRAGRFREDLYYRAAVITLDVPPLRERREDIALLTQHFLHKHAGGRRVSMSPEVLRAFELAPWPGNVRELENQVRRALALSGERIELSHIDQPAPPSLRVDELDLHAQTELLTRTLVEQALSRAAGNLTQAAELLGITRFGLQKMVKRLGLGPYVGRQRK